MLHLVKGVPKHEVGKFWFFEVPISLLDTKNLEYQFSLICCRNRRRLCGIIPAMS